MKSQFTSDRFCSDASRDVPVIAILIALQREQQAKNPMKKNCKKKALNRPHKNFEPILNDVQKYCNWMDIFIDRRK